MRKATWMTAALVGALLTLPRTAPAQVKVSVAVGTRLGPEIGIFAYSSQRYGNWRAAYVRWTPVVVYEYRGRYYPHPVRGARAVAVYRYRNEYFLPPRDAAWVHADRRFDYKHRPVHDDWDRARGHDRDDRSAHAATDDHGAPRQAHEVQPGNGGRR